MPQDNSENLLVSRAVAEYRAGRGVIISHDMESLFSLPVEALAGETGCKGFSLILSANRLKHIGYEQAEAGKITLMEATSETVERLALEPHAEWKGQVDPVTPLDLAALQLARLAYLTPAVTVRPVAQTDNDSLRVPVAAVMAYRDEMAKTMRIVSRAPVPLEHAHTEFVVFRGGDGLKDHVAIIVADPDFTQPVAVRLHSACLTGDLFGSLKCDCGDQLRRTVKQLAEHGGGILLYLDQEGRGNGLSNKIRAYQLQARGYNTYAADACLGYELDQRRFDFAGHMLRQLGVARVILHTNNPEKISGLASSGIEVVSSQQVHGRITEENVGYLETKRDFAGHAIDI